MFFGLLCLVLGILWALAVVVMSAAGQMDAARLLIARGARLEDRTPVSRETPLIEAAQMNHADMVELLLDHGADLNTQDVLGYTALEWAQKNKNIGMEELLRRRAGDRRE
jgi:ankyrin repeat protein